MKKSDLVQHPAGLKPLMGDPLEGLSEVVYNLKRLDAALLPRRIAVVIEEHFVQLRKRDLVKVARPHQKIDL